jgi:acyl-coenzyme A thioesterase PaaI-like protein
MFHVDGDTSLRRPCTMRSHVLALKGIFGTCHGGLFIAMMVYAAELIIFAWYQSSAS